MDDNTTTPIVYTSIEIDDIGEVDQDERWYCILVREKFIMNQYRAQSYEDWKSTFRGIVPPTDWTVRYDQDGIEHDDITLLVLSNGMVTPIRNGYVFAVDIGHKAENDIGSIPVSIYVSEYDGRRPQIKIMRRSLVDLRWSGVELPVDFETVANLAKFKRKAK